MGEYLETWLAGKAALRSTTAKSYREHLDLYLLPALGHLKLTELHETDVESLFAAMRLIGVPGASRTANPELSAILAARKTSQTPKRLAPASQRRVHATLRAALNTAVKRRLIAYNPAVHIELPRGHRPEAVVWNAERTAQWRTWRDRRRELTEAVIVAERKLRRAAKGADPAPLETTMNLARAALLAHTRSWTPPAVAVWTPAQTGQFLDSIEGHRLYALYHLIAFRGLRRGEAIGLPWFNVDLDNGFLTVSTQIVQLGWATEHAAPKSDSEGGRRPRRRHHRRPQRAPKPTAPRGRRPPHRLAEHGPGVHPRGRHRAPPRAGQPHLRPARPRRRPAAVAAARPTARRGDVGVGRRCRPEGRLVHAAALLDHHHCRHLHLGATRDRPRRSRSGGRSRAAPVRPGPHRPLRSHIGPT